MGLAVAIFVPEGIVFVSDGLAEMRNSKSDNGFLQKKQRRIFSFKRKFLICMQGSGYINGLPYSYYINRIFSAMDSCSFEKTEDFCLEFNNRFSQLCSENNRILFYVAGVDRLEDNSTSLVVYLVDDMKCQVINKSNNGDIVYNYHAIGRSMWINKLMLPTYFEASKEEKIKFEDLDVDFSKYSLEEAIEFGKSMLNISYKMDNFVQLKQMVGEYISVGYITIDSEITIKNIYESL